MGKIITRTYDPTTDPLVSLADIDAHIQSLFEEVTRGAGAQSQRKERKSMSLISPDPNTSQVYRVDLVIWTYKRMDGSRVI